MSGIILYLSFCDWLISLSIMSSSFTYVIAVLKFPSFLRLTNVPLYVCAAFHLCIQPLIEYNFSYYQILYRNSPRLV